MSNEGPSTSLGLLRRSIHNDALAWRQLTELYGPLVYGWCRRWGLQPCDAEEVGQETFLKVARHLPGFRKDRPGDSFRAWLYSLTYTCYVDFLRQRQAGEGGSDALARLQALPALPPADDPALLSAEIAFLYERAVKLIRDEFARRDWAVFEAVVMHGRPAVDVAREQSITPNVVYLTKSRILRRLKEEFADLLPETLSPEAPPPNT